MNKESISPPVAEKKPHRFVKHGDIRIDDYFWLRERDNPDVIDYLKAENSYTRQMTAHNENIRNELYKEFLRRIKETDQTVPDKKDNYYYYSRTEKGKQYPIYCRKKDSPEADEEIYLDVNDLARDQKYFRLGVVRISPDHRMLAYSTDTSGAERYTLYIKDLEKNNLVDVTIEHTHYSLEWANDCESFLYTVLDDANRPHKIYRHTIGQSVKEDVLLYQEDEGGFYVWLSKSRSESFIVITIANNNTSEVRYFSADNSNSPLHLIHPRQAGVEYSIDHRNDSFYILTNEDAKNFKLMEALVDDPSKKNWKELIPHRENIKLEDIDAFRDYLVIYEREDGLKKIRIQDFSSGEIHSIGGDEAVYNITPGTNLEYETNVLRYHYSSFVTPPSVYDFNMKNYTRELKKQTEVLNGYDPSHYISERIYATSHDGVKVPVSVVYKKGLEKNSNNPLLLYGYGAYGISIDPTFSHSRLSLLDRGFIYVIAHIRGGSDMGRQWYEDGKLMKKKNTFFDFIACAEHLIEQKYTSPDKLVIYGASAGGMLVGAVLNMYPNLFKAAIATVPFVDVLSTMLDPSLPLTVIEYNEWGNPEEKVYYDYIKSYCPYDNVSAQKYPNILVTAGMNDPRVQYWEPAKWVAKLRAHKTDGNVLLLKMDMGAGHAGASGRYDYLKDIAFEYAFLFDVLGIEF